MELFLRMLQGQLQRSRIEQHHGVASANVGAALGGTHTPALVKLDDKSPGTEMDRPMGEIDRVGGNGGGGGFDPFRNLGGRRH